MRGLRLQRFRQVDMFGLHLGFMANKHGKQPFAPSDSKEPGKRTGLLVSHDKLMKEVRQACSWCGRFLGRSSRMGFCRMVCPTV